MELTNFEDPIKTGAFAAPNGSSIDLGDSEDIIIFKSQAIANTYAVPLPNDTVVEVDSVTGTVIGTK